MEAENDMLVLIWKGRPDSISNSVSNTLTVVIVKNNSGQRVWWRVLCEDGANILMHLINVLTAEEGSRR
jgi:hypothetical protein